MCFTGKCKYEDSQGVCTLENQIPKDAPCIKKQSYADFTIKCNFLECKYNITGFCIYQHF